MGLISATGYLRNRNDQAFRALITNLARLCPSSPLAWFYSFFIVFKTVIPLDFWVPWSFENDVVFCFFVTTRLSKVNEIVACLVIGTHCVTFSFSLSAAFEARGNSRIIGRVLVGNDEELGPTRPLDPVHAALGLIQGQVRAGPFEAVLNCSS